VICIVVVFLSIFWSLYVQKKRNDNVAWQHSYISSVCQYGPSWIILASFLHKTNGCCLLKLLRVTDVVSLCTSFALFRREL